MKHKTGRRLFSVYRHFMPASKLARQHRHFSGEHLEEELRYYRPTAFAVPQELASMTLVASQDNHHHDRYFDGMTEDGPVLRGAGCSLRIREKSDGSLIATFKRKIKDSGAVSLRMETEAALSAQASLDDIGALLEEDSIALNKAKEIAGDTALVYLFSIRNARVDHHYKSDEAHVVLSEDFVTFPDESMELRVEVELVHGPDDILGLVHGQLQAFYPDISVCKRGKLSEGRRRMLALLR